jgi:integrase
LAGFLPVTQVGTVASSHFDSARRRQATEESLPSTTFDFFAGAAGYVKAAQIKTAITKRTWTDLCDVFELEMKRLIANKQRGATSEEGIMSESTRDRYRQTIRHFTAFLGNKNTLLDDIKSSTIELFKVDRARTIDKLKQSRGGSSIALDIAVLHRIFTFGVSKRLMIDKPINLRNESKPGKNPKNGARPFNAEEIANLREHAGQDLFTFLLLRWTGLRGSDVVNLQWRNVHLDRGQNGEIEVLTQKRGKTAIVPLSTELRNALEEIKNKQTPDDIVLCNPETKAPFSNRKRLYERMKALGERAKVNRVTPHCFRDTFACDMLARGASIYDVAKMLADTVDTVEKHYASFIPAARDAAQSKRDNGIGIEERAKLSKARDRKVVAFPASA